MKNEINKIDKLIKESLTKEESKFYDDLAEQDLFGKLGSVYKGRMGWVAILMIIVSLISFSFMVYCAVEFFKTEVVKDLIMWACFFFTSLGMVCMIKIYFWMQMNRNDVLRELKRLELQISGLNTKSCGAYKND